MKAFIQTTTGGPTALELTNLPTPAIGPDEVLIRVRALSLNPVDVKTTHGKGIYGRLKEAQPLIPGWDVAGEVAAVGAEVRGLQVGEAVFGMVNFPGHGCAYAEYVAAPAAQLARQPAAISPAEAAAATLAALTAWQVLVTRANVQPGQRVLVHAAAGGVGHFAVQLLKERGAYVIGTSSAAKRDFVLSLGADEHVDYTQARFEDAVAPVDVVLDTIGGDNALRSLQVLKPGGQLISIVGALSPEVMEQARAAGSEAYFMLVSSSGADMQELAARLADGRLRAHVSAVFPFAELPAALQAVESGHTQGKVVVSL